MTAKDHNRLLSIFFFIQGGLQVFAGIIIFFIYGGIGTAMLASARRNEEQAVGGIFIGIAFVIALFILVFAGFSLLTGWKLFKEKSAGRIMGIIASCLCLLSFPLGTALGIYGLWFLLGEQGKHFYEGGGNMPNNYPPPPPNHWQ
ncbi:MAG: hypothetical protein M3033_08145 [Acidobacteriota bacterium]|nr:hypothetical protein [Acidobacteriota bacterium]